MTTPREDDRRPLFDLDPRVIEPRDLSERVRERLDALGQSLPEPGLDLARTRRDLGEQLKFLQVNWSVAARPITRSRLGFAPLVSAVKRSLRAVLKWYVEDRWSSQAELNGATMHALGDVQVLIEALTVRLDAAEARNHALTAELAALRGQGDAHP